MKVLFTFLVMKLIAANLPLTADEATRFGRFMTSASPR
jgi:hypothetical protein